MKIQPHVPIAKIGELKLIWVPFGKLKLAYSANLDSY